MPPHSKTLSRFRSFCACSADMKKRLLISLIIVALLCGVLWREELELRWGWESLAWGEHFHWAIPFGGLIFMTWVSQMARPARPWKLMAELTLLWAVFYAVLEFILLRFFSRWLFTFNFHYYYLGYALPLIWLLLPPSFFVVCRRHGLQTPRRLKWMSLVCFFASWPLAVWLLDVVDHRGGADLIHALKSGFVIPLLVLSLGFPLLFAKRADESASSHA